MATNRFRRVLALVTLVVVLSLAWAGSAQAAVTVSRAEVSADRLRIEGQAAASRPITVDGVAMTTSSSSGSFRIERSGFSSPADCTVDVNDGTGAVSARLSGCTVAAPPAAASLSSAVVSPSTVQGGATATVTVALTAAAPAGGATVQLSTGSAAVSVPASVTVAPGSSSATAPASTSAVSASTTATVTATYAGVSRNATLTVTAASSQPAAALAGLTVSPTTLQGGGSMSATVTLTAAAPAGGAVVSLSSSHPTVVAVPSSVTVPAGSTSAFAFPTTQGVTSSTTVTLTATYAGGSQPATVTVTPPPPSSATLTGLTLSPSTVQSGTTGTSATVTFSSLTPAGGATLQVTSSNPALATVPATVTVAGNSSTGAFPVTIGAGSGTATISATYQGVTRSAVLTVQTQTLFRIITESPLPNARVGENYAGFIEACCGQGTPYRWSLVSGTVPDGLRFAGDSLRLSRTTGVTGVPTRVQTTTFTVRARDGAGNTATKTFTLTVDPAAPLAFNSPSRLTDGSVGVSYFANLFATGGVTPYRWTLVAGALPPGLTLQASPGRIQGTPTAAGTYVFTLRVADSGGQSTSGQFTIVIG